MDGPKDDLKWFGEGFDGFPKRLPEDCVEYMLYIIDSQLTAKETLARLELVRKEASKLTTKLLKDYVWQRDIFALKLELDDPSCARFLKGLTNYGDSVEDEWLIVYLLRELSKGFPDLWIKVVDTDGEFLLIEAANTLPRWLNPEIADNRVWINNNMIRIIPLTAANAMAPGSKTAPVSRPLTLAEAHETISAAPNVLIHSPMLEAEAFYRLKNYPEQIQNALHYTRVTIPRRLAYVLHDCPASIAPAIESFYLRDPIALKSLQVEKSKQVFSPDDLVTTSVRFTKVLYAQLKSQQFSAPNSWKSILTAAETVAISDHEKQAVFARLQIGMKVTSGFEMLINNPVYRDNRSVREMEILLEDLKTGATLPTDAEVKSWLNSDREDDEGWLDINFEDFEKELAGKAGDSKSKGKAGIFGPELPSGFGDAKTQADLKKMVQRFEEFLNDEDAGIDGAELDDMDIDDDDEDDDDDDDEEDSEDEDKEVSFDENEFARMMREMMGLPPTEADQGNTGLKKGKNVAGKGGRIEELDSDDEEASDDGEEIRKVMDQIEAELNEAGALNLDPTPQKLAALKGGKSKDAPAQTKKNYMEKQDWEDESDEEIDIDFNLAKNLLESFKSQAGMAGPGGNLMGMMGMQLPRDEDEASSPSSSSKQK